MRLEGRTAIITGADSGIGQATAEAFARAGADVAIGFHSDEEGAAETCRRVEAAGRRATRLRVDVGQSADVKRFFDEAEAALGPADLLVANAGKGMGGMPVAELDEELATTVFRTDLYGPLFCAHEFVNRRRAAGGGGRMVIVGSVAGHLPTPNSAPYGMAKAAVNSLVRSLSREWAEDRINVNAVAPGLIDTPMTADRLQDPEKREDSMKNIPWHRPGRPEEIADLVLFLAADTGDYVTGQTWTMDGGLTMNWGGA
jgi:glucose 1-dehydrogenase